MSDEQREVESFGQTVRCSGKSKIPMAVQVAHFIPATFPLVPTLRETYMPLCRSSWQVIVAQRERNEHGIEIHGITAFYNDFYERLGKVDTGSHFEKVLMKHAIDTNKIAAKGAILIRVVEFMLRIDGDTPGTRAKFRMLGQSHNKYAIRPWMYAVFLELFLLTLASRLQTAATPSVMEAWVNLLGYSLQQLLPGAINGLVLESEAHVNYVLCGDSGGMMHKAPAQCPNESAASTLTLHTVDASKSLETRRVMFTA